MKLERYSLPNALDSQIFKRSAAFRRFSRALTGVAFFLGLAATPALVMAQTSGPDGKIVYSANNGDYSDIFLMNADGSGTPVNLTNTPVDSEYAPVWSPDGTHIAYARVIYYSYSAAYDLWIMNSDGTGQANLTRTSGNDEFSPTWSPDSQRLAFVRIEENAATSNDWGIFVMDVDGGNVESLTNDIESSPATQLTPAWSPLGDKIAFASVFEGKKRLMLMNTDGSNQETLTSSGYNDQSPSWSPDGSKITFMRDMAFYEGQWDVFLMNADGTGQTNLTQHPSVDHYPTFSPDGTQIAFQSNRDTFAGDIYLIGVPPPAPAIAVTSTESALAATVEASATSPTVTRLNTNGVNDALDWRTQAAATVSVADFAFTPATVTIQEGQMAEWIFKGPSNHTVTDRTGMGLFDSGITAPGSAPFTVTFPSAGIYPYLCHLHSAMRGKVQVPIQVSPATGGVATQFTITWSSAGAPAGFVFDIQIKRPGASSFVDWKLSRTRRRTVFTADAGAGRYSFRARLRKLSDGTHSAYSPARHVSVQ